jgi:hypothetical protein
MSRYDYRSLSSQDFEELTRDLLQAEWKVALEAFKTGRDKGIDLRYTHANGGKTIVQCKHYAGSGFAKLLDHLRDIEKPKIERLKPVRYVVVTSVGLTPNNKDEIARALHPFVVNVRDIMGAQDIDGLLSRHSGVERANFKLWLTSTNVIERVLHNAEICQTEFEVARIRKKLPLFVQSKAFPRAMQMLEERRIVVISGAPGIGKTTLAEMLLYTHLEQGYQPVVIKAEIAEGKSLFKADTTKQVFYYDDFLGQIYLGDRTEYLGRNQDAVLTDFMELVRDSNNGRFILTTREHILRAALQMSERFSRSPMLEHRYVLELDDYTFAHRARILYNDLYFSGLAQPYKEAVLEEDFFLQIIKHKHFNPRLIEWLSTALRQREVAASGYRKYISQLLKSPNEIWTHAFSKQISQGARDVLLGFYTLGEWVSIADLEPVFRSLHQHRATRYHQPIAPGDFRNALQELDGAFLSYSSGYGSYLNPSIREFIAGIISGDRDTAEDLLTSSVRIKQLVNLWELSKAQPQSQISAVISETTAGVAKLLSRLLRGPSIRWEKTRHGELRGHPIDIGDESRIGFLANLAEDRRSREILDVMRQASNELVAGWNHTVPDFTGIMRLLAELGKNAWVMGNGGRDIYHRLIQELLEHLTFATASDWIELVKLPKTALDWTAAQQAILDKELKAYCENGVQDDRYNRNGPDEMSELRDSLTSLGEKIGYDFSYQIQRLEEDIAEKEEEPEPLSEGGGIPRNATVAREEVFTDDDARQMFSTLVSGVT